jgi:hypothetical protein
MSNSLREHKQLSHFDNLALQYQRIFKGAAHSAEIRARLEKVQTTLDEVLSKSSLSDEETLVIGKSIRSELKFFDKEHKRLYVAFRRVLTQEEALHRIDIRYQRRWLKYKLSLILCAGGTLLLTYWLAQQWQIPLPFIG